MNTRIKYFGLALALVGVGVLIALNYRNSARRYVSPIFSPVATLQGLWTTYKTAYLEPGTFRTLDRQQDDITTSEGQSYTLLRAVWQDDRTTFDGTWHWTKDNLQHTDDALFSWLFGRRADGTYGVITDRGGQNAATDADVDIALALLFASSRWGDAAYSAEAEEILDSIWKYETLSVQGKTYLAANDLEQRSAGPYILNPSYCAPYAYRIFAQADPKHDWLSLVDSCYDVVSRSIEAALDTPHSANLPPNWILLQKDGTLTPPAAPLTTHFGYDAIRVPFRLALDYQWFQEPRAKQLLERMSFLGRQWEDRGMLAAVYKHDGTVQESFELPAVYGATIGYFRITQPAYADDVFRLKLQSLYNPDTTNWKEPLSYYDTNWAWFGMALFYESLPNLFLPR